MGPFGSGSGRGVIRTTTPRQATAYMRPMPVSPRPDVPYSGVGPYRTWFNATTRTPSLIMTVEPAAVRCRGLRRIPSSGDQRALDDLLTVAGRGRIRGQTLRR
jgi:hypothetical protein